MLAATVSDYAQEILGALCSKQFTLTWAQRDDRGVGDKRAVLTKFLFSDHQLLISSPAMPLSILLLLVLLLLLLSWLYYILTIVFCFHGIYFTWAVNFQLFFFPYGISFVIKSRVGKGWVVALSHGPEPTEQTLTESKENTATKKQMIRSTAAKKKDEKEKTSASFSPTCSDSMFRGNKAGWCVHNSLLTDSCWCWHTFI